MKRILFVDDDVDLLLTVKALLGRKGFEVATTTSCKEALEILRAFQPDLILLDINVGDDDGRLVCRQIKEQAAYAHVPVILVSANDEALRTYRDYRADSVVKKPFDFSELVESLNVYL